MISALSEQITSRHRFNAIALFSNYANFVLTKPGVRHPMSMSCYFRNKNL